MLAPEIDRIARYRPEVVIGRVAALRGLTVLVRELPLPVGALVAIGNATDEPVHGEIVGFTNEAAVVMTLGQTAGIRAGQPVTGLRDEPTADVGVRMLGRVVNALGLPIDGMDGVADTVRRPISPPPIGALHRARIREQLLTGVRAIDLMTPIGRGQRLGLFAGPGVGKSTLLGQIARGAQSDVNVIALIGERGREVRDFLESSLGEEGLARSVVVVATGDEPPLLRLRAAKLACTIAEFFREHGLDVLMMMDSVTRFAHAQRQVGLSAGEPPATKGYTPSVFSELPLLLERAGAVEGEGDKRGGSITGLYTILVEGDDMTEPVADAARGILDGHVILSRKLAQRAHFPAIDPLDSVSRVADEITDVQHQAGRRQVTRLLAAYREVEELVRIGAYAQGSDAETDAAIELKPAIDRLLQQGTSETSAFEREKENMVKLAMQSGEMIRARVGNGGGS